LEAFHHPTGVETLRRHLAGASLAVHFHSPSRLKHADHEKFQLDVVQIPEFASEAERGEHEFF
jgi:hypothetical protein